MAHAHQEQKAAGANVVFHAILLLVVVFIYLIYNVSQFDKVSDVNALDYAQIARHVYRGEGFTTSFIKPLSLVYNQSIENHPDLTYPPLHILWTAGMMKLLGPNDKAVAHSSGLAFLLGVPVVYLLAWRIFGRRTAMLASVLYGTNIAYLGFAISGLEAPLLSTLVTLLLLFLYQAGEDHRREGLWVILAGVVMGLLYLTKYIWGLAIIPTVIFLWAMNKDRRLVRPLVFVGLALLVSSPWLVRNWRLTGNPFFTLRSIEALEQTKRYPGNSLYRTYDEHVPSFIHFAASNPRAIFDKLRAGMLTFYRTIPNLAGIYITALFLVAIIVVMGGANFERWRYMIYGYIGIIALGLSLLIAAPRLLMPIGPAALVIATGYFWRLLDQRLEPLPVILRGRATAIAVGIVLALHLVPVINTLTPSGPQYAAPEDSVITAAVQLNDETQGLIVTDLPWMVAWVADRDALWLPQTPADMHKCEQAVGRFQWLLLSPMLPRIAPREKLENWAAVWARGLRADTEYQGFVVVSRLSTGRWILLKRRPVTETENQ
ncbi:MAG: glycosyltransferase family 39 protein [Armatimonadetes bacterium]|nr:glycosyltransferase family 39 protein [Armatimonadota bacterium]